MPEKTIQLTTAQLQQLLQNAGQYGSNSFTGPSIIDQYRNFSAQGNALNNLTVGKDITQQQFDSAKAGINAGKASSAVSGGLAVMGGVTDILNNSLNMANINDTTEFQNQVDDIRRIGSGKYNSFNQLSSEYGKLASAPGTFDYDEIRGGSTEERIGGVLSSTLSGATTGYTVGGPWGALGGAVIGLGAGVGGWIAGDNAAKAEKDRLETQAKQYAYTAGLNLESAGEQLRNRDFRAGVGNRSALGGKIERRQETIQEFAARALKRPRRKDSVSSGRIIRRHGEGGTIIRIKR